MAVSVLGGARICVAEKTLLEHRNSVAQPNSVSKSIRRPSCVYLRGRREGSRPPRPRVNDAEQFQEQRKAARAGEWVVYGARRLRVAQANLAEAQGRAAIGGSRISNRRSQAHESNDRISMIKSGARVSTNNTHLKRPSGNGSNHKADQAAEQAAGPRSMLRMRAACMQCSQRRRQAEARAETRAIPLSSPVLKRGDPNQWDDFKVMSPVVIKEGSGYRMWYSGCHLCGDEYTCGVGHAQSRDGVGWEKSPGPVLTMAIRRLARI